VTTVWRVVVDMVHVITALITVCVTMELVTTRQDTGARSVKLKAARASIAPAVDMVSVSRDIARVTR